MAIPTAADRRNLAKAGIAMPDGSFYIRNAAELNDAILAVGRTKPNKGQTAEERRNEVRRHIIKRANAKDVNRPDMIPDTWNADGTLKHMELEAFIAHFGRKGMKWGEHRFGRDRSTGSTKPASSSDHTRARAAQTVVKIHGTHVLSNEDLKALTERLNLEQNYNRLTAESSGYDKGKSFVQEVLHLGKMGLDAYNTGKQVKKALDELKKH